MITIGQKIEEYFDYLGYTYDEVGSATDISTEQLLKIFKNERELSEKEMQSFAILFNTSVQELSNGISIEEFPVAYPQAGLTEKDNNELNKFTHYLKNPSKK